MLLQKQHGFSLVEVLVVLVILAILAILITPAYTTYITQYRLTSAAEALYDDINRAHSYAITQPSTVAVTLVFQTGSAWCYGTTVSSTCDCTTTACELGRTTSAEYSGSDISLAITGFSGNKTQFDSMRGIPTVTGSATFSASGGETITVSINKLGVPKICASGVGGYPSC